jgi:hypothetical protein
MKMMTESIGYPRDPYDINFPLYEKWQEYVNAYISKAPESMK